MALDSVRILYRGGTAEIEVKKSRFIANLKPVESEEEAARISSSLRSAICSTGSSGTSGSSIAARSREASDTA